MLRKNRIKQDSSSILILNGTEVVHEFLAILVLEIICQQC